ncbi:hypothetical protein [Methyloceanibacter sp.]|jgi:ElaB/YqjD/DUF883 family membrane-anchored ribosome-binding protein|uniref:hypothetical protein n=1 Tax=Methyloceanibacter sp. TaxID=1965321 RepID=UPI002B6B579F|nr:hypothetical protein [Methyloceanibacter sp.]
MVSLDKAARFVRDVNVDDLRDQLDGLRDYMNELTHSAGSTANRRIKQARLAASSAATDAEELMKDNLAASLILAAALGVVVGYLIRRGSE